jgi:hypothetical protein
VFKQINDVIVALTRKFTSNFLSNVREQLFRRFLKATFKKYSKVWETQASHEILKELTFLARLCLEFQL